MVEAIESILSQTYKNWELLLVDDGSSDSSTQIALDYEKKYPEKLTYLDHEKHENRGMSASRNLGVSKIKGECVTFLDADDVLFPNSISAQVEILNSFPDVSAVFGSLLIWHSWTDEQQDAKKDFIKPSYESYESNKVYNPPELLDLHLGGKKSMFPGICAIMTRRAAIENVGGFEDYFTGMFEDQIFRSKLALKEKIYVLNTCLAKYRQHSYSHKNIAVKTGDEEIDRLRYLTWLEMYILPNKEINNSLWGSLQHKISHTRNKLLQYYSKNYNYINKLNSANQKQKKQIIELKNKCEEFKKKYPALKFNKNNNKDTKNLYSFIKQNKYIDKIFQLLLSFKRVFKNIILNLYILYYLSI